MKERRFFYKQLTKAEVGDAKTHEKYIRFPNDFDYEQFFSEKAKTNGTVLQIDINAQYNWDSDICIPLKFVFYANSNKEKRMPSLGPLFDEYNVSVDDIFCLEAVACGSEVKYSICFKKSDEISLLTSPICYIDKLDAENKSNFSIITDDKPSQEIYFGAPGTGKSFKIDERVDKNNSVRTTFHPDSDYSTFVGCYKPCKTPVRSNNCNVSLEKLIAMANEITSRPAGDKVGYIIDFVTQYAERLSQIVEENDDIISLNNLLNKVLGFSNETYLTKVISKTLEDRKDKAEITYDFVPQAFTTAYINAWKNLEEPYYLVIEEINRGNCAQIFGDIFQLLDRDSKSGYSSYKITPDKDLQEYLFKVFADTDIADNEIKQGEKMQLPSNLNILATMNTSDQSLFPIDSAFKRRWDWKYIPIDYTDKGHYITCGTKQYKWTEFLEAVNKRIESVTQSEDKKMGGWFVKPNGKEITADKFVSKVVFYLWNDVFKDFGHDGNTIFKDDFDKFHKFFDFKGDVKLDVLEKFLVSLGLKPINQESQNTESTEEVQS